MERTRSLKLTGEGPRHRQIFDLLQREIRESRYRPGERLPTEAELMQHFAVSRSTVSRALGDLERLGLVLRRRGSGTFVRQSRGAPAARELVFFAPWVASGEPLPHVEGRIHQHLADLAGQARARMALQCLSTDDGSLRERMVASATRLREAGFRGVFYYPAELPQDEMHFNREVVDLLTGAGMAVVLIDRDVAAWPGRSELTRIGFDNRRGGYVLTEHLIRSGSRRIAFVGIPQVSTAALDRLTGYHEALRAHDIIPEPDWVRLVEEPDAAFCNDLLAAAPDAIICKSDRFAALVGRQLLTLGVSIGTDIRLAGFDDDPLASFLPAPLTTVRLPAAPFARAAFEALQQQIADPSVGPRQIIIDTELVVRQSTADAEGPSRKGRS